MVPTVCFWCSCVSCILNCNICLSVLFAVPVNHGCANNMKKIRSCLLITFRLHCYGSNPIACATLYCRWLLLNSHFSNLDFMSMVQLFSLVFRCSLPWPCGRPMATVHFLPDHIHICPVKLEPGFFLYHLIFQSHSHLPFFWSEGLFSILSSSAMCWFFCWSLLDLSSGWRFLVDRWCCSTHCRACDGILMLEWNKKECRVVLLYSILMVAQCRRLMGDLKN